MRTKLWPAERSADALVRIQHSHEEGRKAGTTHPDSMGGNHPCPFRDSTVSSASIQPTIVNHRQQSILRSRLLRRMNRQPPPTTLSPSHPTITLGPYTGDQLSVDHIIPFAVAPQLDHVIANLELMPLRMNFGKRDKMGQRQMDLLQRLRQAGLL
ncbi:MAG TPA: hypothetical protein DDZ88_27360 [Verrucomicrobiales bacterium]|nr:hypothetical protein [Verrucomicrobiales bacterium]